jgi:hypothetical protein
VESLCKVSFHQIKWTRFCCCWIFIYQSINQSCTGNRTWSLTHAGQGLTPESQPQSLSVEFLILKHRMTPEVSSRPTLALALVLALGRPRGKCSWLSPGSSWGSKLLFLSWKMLSAQPWGHERTCMAWGHGERTDRCGSWVIQNFLRWAHKSPESGWGLYSRFCHLPGSCVMALHSSVGWGSSYLDREALFLSGGQSGSPPTTRLLTPAMGTNGGNGGFLVLWIEWVGVHREEVPCRDTALVTFDK